MKLLDNNGFIKIEFHELKYDDSQYVEILMYFNLKGIGWGVVGNQYFSLSSIKNIAVNLEQILIGGIPEYHISDNDPDLIPKPFYWIDVSRTDEGYLFHIKIHDCIDDYIEVTEIVTMEKLITIQEEFKETYNRLIDI